SVVRQELASPHTHQARKTARALQRAHVFAAQKQCFCLERLSALKEFEMRYAISNSVKARAS
ncbi:hypothetical protein HMPREF3216_00998, partial [Gardnerella vaginalis]